MIYNDFPILNNQTYNLLNEHFSHQQNFDRKSTINLICKELNILLNTNIENKNQYNRKIRKSIENCLHTTRKLFDNFSSLFNLAITPKHSYINLNVFSFLNRLTKTLSILTSWQHNEEKEYYKTLANKSMNEIIINLSDILSTLEESNLYFFKYM